jgi:DNA-binding protein HU-beta
MANKGNSDFFSSLRSQGLRKSVAKALSDLETRSPEARAGAERVAQRVASDLRNAAEMIERRLNVGGAGTRSEAAKKAASTRKRAASKRSAAAKKGAATPARKTSASKSTAGKSSARKSSAGTRATKTS